MAQKRVVLLILDGLGEGETNISNPFRFAKTPNFSFLKKNFPFLLLASSGISVGLASNQPGNCEMGHLTMGTGIVYYQNYPRINLEIESGAFFRNQRLLKIFDHCRQFNSRLHFVGLLSQSFDKSSFEHLLALLELSQRQNFFHVYLHLFTDGLESPPQSALSLLEKLTQEIKNKNYPGKIASLCGRFYALDETGNYLLRTQKTFLLLVEGLGNYVTNPFDYLKKRYEEKNFNDSLLEPLIIEKEGIIKDNDAVLFFNYESKSIFQLAQAFFNPDFKEFKRPERKNLYLASLTRYLENLDYPVIFEPPKIKTNLTRILAENKLKQIKLVDKTREKLFRYYFNGFFEEEHPGEVYKIFPPFETNFESLIKQSQEMLDYLKLIVKEGNFDFILMNLPVFDLVGHQGDFSLAIKVIEKIDELIGSLYEDLLHEKNLVLIITSDHGNIEKMVDPRTGQKDTGHNLNPSPFIFIDQTRKREKTKEELNFYHRKILGSLADLAPTVLELFGLKIPQEFEGKSLLRYL